MKPDRLQFAALLVAATAAALSCADHGITGPTAPSIGAPVFASTTSNKGGGATAASTPARLSLWE